MSEPEESKLGKCKRNKLFCLVCFGFFKPFFPLEREAALAFKKNKRKQ